jgi:NAD(P)-dependent dehydrogenase (short-subunit alcohol dehydrogenase family)
MQRLDDKVAIITGGAGGIGEASARRFLADGARVLLTDLDERGLRDAAARLGSDRLEIASGDVSDETTVKRWVDRAVERWGRLDVMFANAGIEGTVRPIAELAVVELDRVLSVNVRGAFLCLKHAWPHLAASKGAAIVTSSVAGLVGSAGLSAYVASKHAVLGLVKTAAIEGGPLGIRVVAISPGPIENRMMRSIEDQAAPGHGGDVKKGFESMVPMRRYGANEEIAALAAFLASDDASYCSGSTFVADGGFVAG